MVFRNYFQNHSFYGPLRCSMFISRLNGNRACFHAVSRKVHARSIQVLNSFLFRIMRIFSSFSICENYLQLLMCCNLMFYMVSKVTCFVCSLGFMTIGAFPLSVLGMVSFSLFLKFLRV